MTYQKSLKNDNFDHISAEVDSLAQRLLADETFRRWSLHQTLTFTTTFHSTPMFEIKREATVGPSWMNYELRVDSGLKNAFSQVLIFALAFWSVGFMDLDHGNLPWVLDFQKPAWDGKVDARWGKFKICKYSLWSFKEISLFDQAEGW